LAGQDVRTLKAAGAMSAATFLSRIAGLVREQVFAFFFGASHATDAFNIAFRIPNLLRDLFAEGAMSSALVPTFTKVREQEGVRRSWQVAGRVFRVLFVSVAFLAAVGVFFAEPLVKIYAGDFAETPGKLELTILLTQILFPFFPLVAVAAAFMGVLNASGRFFLPAFASALFNVASIVSGVILTLVFPYYGFPAIAGMAVGVVIGGAVQAACQWPALRAVGYRLPKREDSDPKWNRDPALTHMLLLMGPGLVGQAATQVNVLVNSVLATSQGAGAVSWLNYAFRLMQFPIGVFGVALAAATLPVVSTYWARFEYGSARDAIQSSLGKVLVVNLLASAGLAALGVPILSLLFEQGRFTSSDTQATAQALAAYALGLSAYSVVKVLVPACYAMGRTRAAVQASIAAVALTVTLNLLWVDRLGFVGLALGTSVGAFANAGLLLWAIRKELAARGTPLLLGRMAFMIIKVLGVCAIMGGGLYFLQDSYWRLFEQSFEPGVFRVLARLAGVSALTALGLGVAWAFCRLFGVTDLDEVTQVFARKIKNKLGSGT
jgi:putative peptidoglycan lipid II flippase